VFESCISSSTLLGYLGASMLLGLSHWQEKNKRPLLEELRNAKVLKFKIIPD
jgi:hypothetical protein